MTLLHDEFDTRKGMARAHARTEEAKRRCGTVQGIVLAGVHPWGDCALERVTSRPLMPVAGRPLVWHPLHWLSAGGVESATVCANGDTGAMRDALGDGVGLNLALRYFEDRMPRGPAGCARDAAAGTEAELLLVVDGTAIPRINLEKLLEAHVRREADVTVVASVARGAAGSDATSLEPVGIYVLSRAVLDHIGDKGYQDIKERLIPALRRAGKRVCVHAVEGGSVPRVIDSESYLAVGAWAVQSIAEMNALPPGYTRRAGAWIHESALIASSAQLLGPVLIGPGTIVGEGAIIVGPTATGAGCVVGERCVVCRTVMWDRCRLGTGSIVDECVLTDDADVEAELVVRRTVCFAPQRRTWTLLAPWSSRRGGR
jgi:NDP-sugar pyrophosphorylase family protein